MPATKITSHLAFTGTGSGKIITGASGHSRTNAIITP